MQREAVALPGLVMSPEHFSNWERDLRQRNLLEWGKKQYPLAGDEWASPEELANLIVFAASGSVRFMTGAVLTVDGGQDKS